MLGVWRWIWVQWPSFRRRKSVLRHEPEWPGRPLFRVSVTAFHCHYDPGQKGVYCRMDKRVRVSNINFLSLPICIVLIMYIESYTLLQFHGFHMCCSCQLYLFKWLSGHRKWTTRLRLWAHLSGRTTGNDPRWQREPRWQGFLSGGSRVRLPEVSTVRPREGTHVCRVQQIRHTHFRHARSP